MIKYNAKSRLNIYGLSNNGFWPKTPYAKTFWEIITFVVIRFPLPSARDIIDIDGVSADNCLIAPFPQSIFLSKLAFSY